MKTDKVYIFLGEHKAGLLERLPDGYRFQYFKDYLQTPDAAPVSLTLPLTETPYAAENLFPFFQGLLPEGWFLDITCKKLKIDPENSFDILAEACRDCIGAVRVLPAENGP